MFQTIKKSQSRFRLVISIILFLILSTVYIVPCHSMGFSKKKPKNQDFVLLFNDTIDTTNLAVQNFANMPCEAPLKDFVAQYNLVKTDVEMVQIYMQNIPETQDELIQLRELELGYGTIYIAEKAIKDTAAHCNIIIEPQDNDQGPSNNSTN